MSVSIFCKCLEILIEIFWFTKQSLKYIEKVWEREEVDVWEWTLREKQKREDTACTKVGGREHYREENDTIWETIWSIYRQRERLNIGLDHTLLKPHSSYGSI